MAIHENVQEEIIFFFIFILVFSNKIMDIQRIVDEIKSVRINLATMHAMEEMHITRIFYGELMTNGWYGMDEVAKVLNNLDYPEDIKEIISDIANVISDIKDQPRTVGRYPNAYKQVMGIK